MICRSAIASFLAGLSDEASLVPRLDGGPEQTGLEKRSRTALSRDTFAADEAEREILSRRSTLAGCSRQRVMDLPKQGGRGPARREMQPDAPHAPDDTCGDLEETHANGLDRGRGQVRRCQDPVAEVRDQEQRDRVQLQARGIRAIPMAAKPIGVDVEFEFLDMVLRRTAAFVPVNEIAGAPPAIRDHIAHARPGRGDIELDQDSAATGPAGRPMLKTRADRHGTLRPGVSLLRAGANP